MTAKSRGVIISGLSLSLVILGITTIRQCNTNTEIGRQNTYLVDSLGGMRLSLDVKDKEVKRGLIRIQLDSLQISKDQSCITQCLTLSEKITEIAKQNKR